MSKNTTQPPKNGRRLIAMLVPVWKPAALVLFLTLLTSGIAAVGPLVQKAIFDALAGQAPPIQQWSPIGFLCAAIGVLLALAILSELINFATSFLSWRIRLRIQRNSVADQDSQIIHARRVRERKVSRRSKGHARHRAARYRS